MSKFPEEFDTFLNPSGEPEPGPDTDRPIQHSTASEALRAIEKKLGIDNSEDSQSIDYRLARLEQLIAEIGQQLEITYDG